MCPEDEMRIIHYAADNPIDPRWRDVFCRVLVWSRKNVLCITGDGLVVVPRRNLRRLL
jgi:hypothetical protein